MELWLSNALVAKHFGSHPHRGRRIKGHTLRSACGIRFAQAWGKGKYVPHEMTVDMVISLQWIKGDTQTGLWRVTATKGFEEIAVKWILDNCQIKPVAQQRSIKRKRRVQVAKWNRPPMKVDNG